MYGYSSFKACVFASYINAGNWISCSRAVFRLILQLWWHVIWRNNFVLICRASCHLQPRFPNITANRPWVTASQLLHISGCHIYWHFSFGRWEEIREAGGILHAHGENVRHVKDLTQRSGSDKEACEGWGVRCEVWTLPLFENV